MNYSEWEKTVARTITDDPLWNLKMYRLALFTIIPAESGHALKEDAPPYLTPDPDS